MTTRKKSAMSSLEGDAFSHLGCIDCGSHSPPALISTSSGASVRCGCVLCSLFNTASNLTNSLRIPSRLSHRCTYVQAIWVLRAIHYTTLQVWPGRTQQPGHPILGKSANPQASTYWTWFRSLALTCPRTHIRAHGGRFLELPEARGPPHQGASLPRLVKSSAATVRHFGVVRV